MIKFFSPQNGKRVCCQRLRLHVLLHRLWAQDTPQCETRSVTPQVAATQSEVASLGALDSRRERTCGPVVSTAGTVLNHKEAERNPALEGSCLAPLGDLRHGGKEKGSQP